MNLQNYSQFTAEQGGKKRGEGLIRGDLWHQTNRSNQHSGEKMHVHQRRHPLVLGHHIHMLAMGHVSVASTGGTEC